MFDLRFDITHLGIGRHVARVGVAAFAAAMLGVAGISGALAQDEGIYGGGGDTGAAPVTTEVAPAPTMTEAAPAPSDAGAAPAEDVQVSEVAPTTLGAEVPAPAPVTEEVAAPAPVAEELPVSELATEIVEGLTVPEPVDVTIDEVIPAALDLTAVFGENFPFPEEAEAEGAVGGDINLGGNAPGEITVGGGEQGEISIGGGVGGGATTS